MSDNFSQDVAIRGEGNIVVGKGDVIINPLPPAEARLRHDLGILLKNVQNTWIRGVLEKSVHETALLELGMELREEAVDNPWRVVMERPGQAREFVPRGKSVKDIFYEANGLLLILGEPGSGKTTTLLKLARDLIAEIGQAFTEPIPVIFNLSTWTNKQQPLDEWLFAELNSKYRLPRKDGKRWLEDRRILPLLDGLDEVKAENRAACVEKINQLASDYGLQGLVVCSRIQDYTALPVRLMFYRAIFIQPLTPDQIEEYLNRAGEKLAGLSAALQADEALRSLAQSPLILNIMTLAYQNASAEDLSNPTLDTDEARREHLFDAYITRMFQRKAGGQQFDDGQTRDRLSWLAQNMQRHNQEVFLIESLQPSWLSARTWQWIYLFASRSMGGLLLGLLFMVIYRYPPGDTSWLPLWVIGLFSGLLIGLIDMLQFEWVHRQKGTKFFSGLRRSIPIVLITGLMSGSLAVLLLPAKYGLDVLARLFFGFMSGLIFGSRSSGRNLESDVQTVEAVRWSWIKALKGELSVGGIVCLLIIMIILSGEILNPPLVRVRPIWSDFLSTLRIGLETGLITGLLGAFFSGWSREIVESKSTANQGISLSIRNSIASGLRFGLFLGLCAWLIDRTLGWRVILVLVLFSAPIGALWYGGLDAIQHYILRLILIIQGRTPRNYAHFLDYAVDRIFLQKVGGGYRFIHRLLLEHFADMDDSGTEKIYSSARGR